MAQEENKFRREMIEAIVSEVINKDGSPYKLMIGKVGSIGVDYFGNIEMGNVLDEEVNMDMKEKVVEELKTMYKGIITESGIVGKLMENVMTLAEKAKRETSREVVNRELMKAANNLKQYANNRLLFVPEAPCQESDVKEKYELAKRITVMEHIMQNNEKDVIDFYRTLISRTEWECRNQIEIQTSQVLKDIAEKIEKI